MKDEGQVMMTTTQVQDGRSSGWWWADNEIIDVYGPKIGMAGIAVYSALLRYARRGPDGKGECFPSLKLLARQLGSSVPTIIKTLSKLEEYGLIQIEQRLSPAPGIANKPNLYTILPVAKYDNAARQEPALVKNFEYPSKNSLQPTKETIEPLVKNFEYPSKNSLHEQDLINKTNINKTHAVVVPAAAPELVSTIKPTKERPPKTEAVKIEEYFTEKATKGLRPLSPIDREEVNALVDKGFTLERCKPGIDQTFTELAHKHRSVGSFKLCVAAIVQLDPANPLPEYSPPPYNQRPNRRYSQDDDYRPTRPRTQAEREEEKRIVMECWGMA